MKEERDDEARRSLAGLSPRLLGSRRGSVELSETSPGSVELSGTSSGLAVIVEAWQGFLGPRRRSWRLVEGRRRSVEAR